MGTFDPVPTATPATERAAVRALEDVGAVSPATARPLGDVPGLDAAAVVPLVARRIVREASPGRYYLYAGTEHARRRTVVLAVLIVILLLIPPILLQLRVR
jgi:hypothetical protein